MTFAYAPKSLADLRQGENIFGDKFLSDVNRPLKPIWFIEEKFHRGQEFFQKYVLSILTSYFTSLLIGFVVPPLAEAVIATNRSAGAEKSRKRYLATMAHIYTWHTSDIFDPSTAGYTSLKMVRDYHDSTRRSLQAAYNVDVYNTTVPQLTASNTKISQFDMALVQSGFIGPICMYPSQFGVSCKGDELDDYRYFWRVIGYVLGMDDEFNVCGGNLHDTKSLSKDIEQLIVVPGLQLMPPYYVTLSDDFVQGFMVLFPYLSKNFLYAFVFPLMGMQPPRIGWLDWLKLKLLLVNFWMLRNSSLYRKYLNYFVLQDLERLKRYIFERIDF